MAIIKCKMCGGDLALVGGQSVAECEYCGSRQTVPVADNEKKLTLFARANRLRAACEFDKAAGIYESIVADFPEEAEAYWGLVLCKYGIEYVDDPATGKKIPTCHRSSFDSIMDDGDYEQVLENADSVARRVYREEVKQIEEIRKGIIAVSANEQPYDIFICYKETDENSDRTLDSVLAQDVYDALSSKGYRVFFSRITLEDKLGVEYEPYIFAALNSAKIMLVFGTDYEYFNAVWVKNEWSRYLKLMAKDKTKHLIPCFKGIDAYDMPKEFARLQAQDLGKVGAMQDLLRGIEKILPRTAPVTVVQEKVVVGGSGNNKIASLLDRGNMALEDGDWAKADSFFEDVLNNDSKNAQSYLGKTLAMERCRTIDALVRKRKDAHQNVTSERQYIEPKTAHINEIAERCSLPGYVDAGTIRNLYDFDLGYPSDVPGRQKQYREEEAWWQNHKQLSRAEKFAAGAVAENLAREKQTLFAQLSERVKSAEKAEAAAITKLQQAYAAHIAQADEKAKKLYNDGLTRREQNYQKLLQIAKNSADVKELTETAEKFQRLGEYQDSRNLAEHCRKRAADEQAKIDAENEQKRTAQAKAAAARKKKNTVVGIVAAVAVCAVAVFFVVLNSIIIPNSKYNDALKLMDARKYEEAIAAFEALDGYKESAVQIATCKDAIVAAEQARIETEKEQNYQAAIALKNSGEYEKAIAAFNAMDGYKDSVAQIAVCETAIMDAQYTEAVTLMDAGEYREALAAFAQFSNYRDSEEQFSAIMNKIAVQEAISAGAYHTMGLKANGTVVAVGSNISGECNVSGWKDIVSISAGGFHTVGLKADGSVVATGDNYCNQCDVIGWKDIVSISTGSSHTVGLKADGSVVAVGSNIYGQCNVSGWKDIIAISAGSDYTVGLKADGSVITAGYNDYGRCDVSDWTDIVAISASNHHTMGLKADGTVVAVGDNDYGQCDVIGWKDIVAISAGGVHTVGLKSDGSVVTTGYNYWNQCDVIGWKDIVAISTGESHTVGLMADGTVVAVGSNGDGRCDVSNWKNIKLPQ